MLCFVLFFAFKHHVKITKKKKALENLDAFVIIFFPKGEFQFHESTESKFYPENTVLKTNLKILLVITTAKEIPKTEKAKTSHSLFLVFYQHFCKPFRDCTALLFFVSLLVFFFQLFFMITYYLLKTITSDRKITWKI